MFDIGFLELLVVGVVGLLVLGPERLPKAARTAGLWIGKIKRSVSGIQREINSQLEAEELRQKLNEQQKKLDAGLDKARRDVEDFVESPASMKKGETTSSEKTPDPVDKKPTGTGPASSDPAPAEDDKDSTPR